MKKYLKYLVLPLLLLVTLLGYQNCSKSSSSGGTVGTVNATAISCSNSGIVGLWKGSVSGQTDTLTITDGCQISSSYCQSSSTVTLSRINSGCPAWATTCGVGIVRTSSSNGDPNCFSTGSEVQCQFAAFKDSTTNELYFNCGGATQAYVE